MNCPKFYSNAAWIKLCEREDEFVKIDCLDSREAGIPLCPGGSKQSNLHLCSRSLRWLPFDIHTASEQLVASFPPITTYSSEPSDIQELEVSIDEFKDRRTCLSYSTAATYFHEAEMQVNAYYSEINNIAKSSRKVLCAQAKCEPSLCSLSAIRSKRRQRDSEDYRKTCVSPWMVAKRPRRPSERYPIFTTHTPLFDNANSHSTSTNDETWIEWFMRSPVHPSTITEFICPNVGKSIRWSEEVVLCYLSPSRRMKSSRTRNIHRSRNMPDSGRPLRPQ
ncbi:hypothetical protein D9613_007955 [Agrocybe pediades]|uniref:Uncharacterized protein n=1 Tax=Agrocybe pediades TaxID=84607 RepID=A0A8H4QMT5_9AGAR|nr:hypothetical protein D9613_007955 [Agrocybe pediades]